MENHTVNSIISALKSHAQSGAIAGMSRYGIRTKKIIGVPAPFLHNLARKIGKNHQLAQQLWSTSIYDARILAALIEDPSLVTKNQMDLWASEFDNWAICDGCCIHLFVHRPHARDKVLTWTKRKKEFTKRAGFALMASLAVHDKNAPDSLFTKYLSIIEREAGDERNGVKKAVNWALRQIGKRNKYLNANAIQTCLRIKNINTPSARWIASDALRELSGARVQLRLNKKLSS